MAEKLEVGERAFHAIEVGGKLSQFHPGGFRRIRGTDDFVAPRRQVLFAARELELLRLKLFPEFPHSRFLRTEGARPSRFLASRHLKMRPEFAILNG